MKKIGLLLLFLMLIGLSFSYSVLEKNSGELIENFDARIAAMGGAGAAEGSTIFSAKLNPANLGFLDFTAGGQFAAGIMKNDDNRSIPMYNFFDGYIDDATYVSNVNYFDEYGLAAYYGKHFSDIRLSGIFSYTPYNSFDCYYEEEVRNDEGSDNDNYPPIIAKNYIDGGGSINSLAFSLAFTYKNLISAGLEIAKLTGDQTLKDKIIWSDYAHENVNDLVDLNEKTKRDFDEMGFKFGLNGQISSRLNMGFVYTPKMEFDTEAEFSDPDTTFSFSDDLIIPSNFRFGVSYRPRNIMRTSFNLDIKVNNWQDVNDIFDTTLNYFLGVEHRLENKMPLRFGFNYQVDFRTIYEDEFIFADKITSPSFSVGTGFVFMDNFNIDLSGQYTYRKYEALDLFMDSTYNYSQLWNDIEPADRGWENPDQVSESFFKLITSISYKW